MNVILRCGPEGAPNSSFGCYAYSRHHHAWDLCVVLVQSDWDYSWLASAFGWIPCADPSCGTDGTVACLHHTVGEMLSAAYDYLAERDGRKLKLPDEYADHSLYLDADDEKELASLDASAEAEFWLDD